MLIYTHQVSQKEQILGVVEVEGSFFGPARVRGILGLHEKGRWTLKQPVFGIYARNGSVYTELVSDCSAKTLQSMISWKISPDSVIHSDCWRWYDGLVDVGYDKHFRINNTKRFAQNGVHINGIEAFWSFTKRRLAKFNGVKRNFELHLKECGWRYNKILPNRIANLKTLVSTNTKLMVQSLFYHSLAGQQ